MARTGHRRAVPGRQRAVAWAAPFRQAGPRGGFSAAAGYGDRTDEESLDRAAWPVPRRTRLHWVWRRASCEGQRRSPARAW